MDMVCVILIFNKFLFFFQWAASIKDLRPRLPNGTAVIDKLYLHGLWAVANNMVMQPDSSPAIPYFRLVESMLVGTLHGQLEEQFPSLVYGKSSFAHWLHEWREHGVCCIDHFNYTLFPPYPYFNRTMQLYARYGPGLSQAVANYKGCTVKAAALWTDLCAVFQKTVIIKVVAGPNPLTVLLDKVMIFVGSNNDVQDATSKQILSGCRSHKRRFVGEYNVNCNDLTDVHITCVKDVGMVTQSGTSLVKYVV